MARRTKTKKTEKNPHAVALARLGARKGGFAVAQKRTPGERSEAARKAVLARWAKAKRTSRAKQRRRVDG